MTNVYLCQAFDACCGSCHDDADEGWAALLDFDMACVVIWACCWVALEAGLLE